MEKMQQVTVAVSPPLSYLVNCKLWLSFSQPIGRHCLDFDIRHMSNTGIDFLGLAYKLVGWDSVGRWTEPLAQFNS